MGKKRAEEIARLQKSWAVYVGSQPTMHKGQVHKAIFRSGVQYFDVGYQFCEDEGGKKKAKWFAKMFLKALENIGVDISTRKRR